MKHSTFILRIKKHNIKFCQIGPMADRRLAAVFVRQTFDFQSVFKILDFIKVCDKLDRLGS